MNNAHGWLLPEMLRLDFAYQGRYELWHSTKTQPNLTLESLEKPEPIPFIKPGDDGFAQTLNMVKSCFEAFGGDSHKPGMQEVSYLAQWILFSLGHPYQQKAPTFESRVAGARRKSLDSVFNLKQLIRFPSDYFGHILANSKYGQRYSSFYPTLQPAAALMAELGHQVDRSPEPVRIFDPCIGTGRLALEASNYARALVGWDKNRKLLEIALANFMLYAPDMALPIPGLGGQLVWGDSLERQGTVIAGHLGQPEPWPILEAPTKPSKPKANAKPEAQLSIF